MFFAVRPMWFSVVCTLIDNDTRHHSGQNVVDSRSTAEWVRNKFWPLWWRVVVLDKSAHHAKPHSICFLPQYQRSEINLCLGNWKHRLGLESARAALCKWAACTRQTFLSKTFANSLNMHRPRKTTFRFVFLPQSVNVKKKMFFQSASWKRHWVTHWPKQHGMDSYLPRQISQSDCEISSNCGKKRFRKQTFSKKMASH